ncbi:MAG: GspH/FimT family pseudopilin [Gemmatimonadaceae bacterium]
MPPVKHSEGYAGYTIVELVLVLTIVGVLMSIAIPRSQRMLDGITVRSAVGDVQATLSFARTLALAGNAAVAVDVDTASGMLRIRRGPEILLSRNVGSVHGVRLGSTRDSLTYDPRGLGRGAANLSIVVRRRTAAETVFVSRFGRVR